jgi:hypothetical protein
MAVTAILCSGCGSSSSWSFMELDAGTGCGFEWSYGSESLVLACTPAADGTVDWNCTCSGGTNPKSIVVSVNACDVHQASMVATRECGFAIPN